MCEIAEACGATKASLYYYYSSKADLLADIISTYLDAVSTAVTRGREARPEPATSPQLVDQLLALLLNGLNARPHGSDDADPLRSDAPEGLAPPSARRCHCSAK